MRTDRGIWNAAAVVVATGAAAVPVVPAVPVPEQITTVAAADYRNPGLIPPGGVLVVGASASGVQIADELQRSGRSVTLAVGEHVRMPRTYRGRDIFWWLDASGVLDERYEAQTDLVRVRNLPSMQLVGSPQRSTLDLNALRRRGVRLVGRFVGVRDDEVQFSGALPTSAPWRPQDGSAAGHPRRVGRPGPNRRRATAPVRPDRTSGVGRSGGAYRRGRDRDDHLGHRLPP